MSLSPSRLLAYGVGLVVLIIALVAGTITLWLPTVLEGRLAALGYENPRVGGASLGLIGGRLEVRNVSADAQGSPALRVHDLAVDWDWTDISRGGVRQVALSGGLLRLARDDAGLWFPAGLIPPAPSGDGEDEASAFSVDLVDVRELRIVAGTEHIELERVQLTDLTALPDTPANLDAVLALAGGAIEAEGRLWPMAQPPRFDVAVRSRGLDAARLVGMAPEPPTVEVAARVSTDITVAGEGEQLRSRGSLRLDGVRVVTPDITLAVDAVDWDGELERAGPGPAVSLDGALGVSGLRAEGALLPMPLAGVSADWKGRLGVAEDRSVDSRFSLSLSPLELTLPGEDGRLGVGGLSWSGDVDLAAGNSGALRTRGVLKVERLDFARAELDTALGALVWDGVADRSADAVIVLDGKATAEKIDVTLTGAEPVRGELRNLDWAGDLKLTPGSGATDIASRSDLSLSALGVTLGARGIAANTENLHWQGSATGRGGEGDLSTGRLNVDLGRDQASAGALSLAAARFTTQGSFDAEQFELMDLRLVRKGDDPGLASIARLRATAPRGGAEEVGADAIEVLGLLINVRRTPEGEWVLPVPQLGGGSDAVGEPVAGAGEAAPMAADAAKAGGETGSGPRIHIGSVSVGNAPGQVTALQLDDRGVKPAVELAISDVELTLGEMDSAKPAGDTPLDLKARFGEHGRIAMAGSVRPFEPRPVVDLKGGFTAVDMIAVSPYLGDAVGYRVRSGSLDADTQVKVAEGRLEVQNELTLYKFAVREVEKGAGKVPLPLALSVLKDTEGKVNLSLPVTGDASAPDFDLSDVVSQAMGTALTQGVLLYVQPLGSVLTVGKLAMAASVAFNPASFAPGTDTLDADNREYLASLADKLKGRPALRISVCGVATESDRLALAPPKPKTPAPAGQGTSASPSQGEGGAGKSVPPSAAPAPAVADTTLVALAERRASVVRGALSGDHGVPQDQLVVCAPELDSNEAALPRVDLGL